MLESPHYVFELSGDRKGGCYQDIIFIAQKLLWL